MYLAVIGCNIQTLFIDVIVTTKLTSQIYKHDKHENQYTLIECLWFYQVIYNTSGIQSTTTMSAIEHFPCNCAKIGRKQIYFTYFICCSQGAVGGNMNSVYKNVVKILMGHLVKEIRTAKCQHFPYNLLYLLISPIKHCFYDFTKGM